MNHFKGHLSYIIYLLDQNKAIVFIILKNILYIY